MANAKLVSLLTSALALAKGGEKEAVEIPSVKAISKMKEEPLTELADQLGISTEDVDTDDLRTLVTTAVNIINGDTDDLDSDDVSSLCANVGVKPEKKQAATIEKLSAYFEADKDAEAEESEEEESEEETEDEEETESEEEEETEESEEEETEEEEDEDEKPAKKKGKKSSDDDEEEAEEEEESEETEEEEEETEEEDSDEEAEEEEAEELTDKHVKLFNKKAKKPVKGVKELTKMMTDDEGNVAGWGEPYVKGDNAYCCGLLLKDAKKGKKSGGICQITGKFFYQDSEGNLVAG